MANDTHEIAELIAQSLQAPLDEEQQRRLDAWRLANEENQQLFEKFKESKWVNAKLAVMYELDKEARRKKSSNRLVPRSKFIHFKSWYYYTAAACVLILLSVGGYWWMNSKKSMPVVQQEERFKNDVEPGSDQKAVLVLADGRTINLDQAKDGSLVQQGSANVVKRGGELKYESGSSKSAGVTYNTLRTPRGGQYQLVLPDGSKVWLNAASSLRYPTSFTGERRVELTGEAYFEVAHSGKPFMVSVRGMEVAVLGTEFNINAYEDEELIKTTLAAGKVKVRKGQDNMILQPGQQAQANTTGLKLKEYADVDQALAWKNGFFQFDNDNLKIVMRQLSRWYDVDVAFVGAVPDISFSGKLRMQSKLSEILTLLEKNEVHFGVEGKRVIVSL